MTIEISAELFPVFAIFRDETKEIRGEMTTDLLSLEGQGDTPAPGVVERLARNAHTLKGNASSLGLADVATLMHSVESLLMGASGRERRIEPAVIDVLLFAIDEVLARAEGILANRPDSGGIRAAHARVEEMLAGVADQPHAMATLSSPAPPPEPGEELLKIGATQFEGFSQVVDELGSAGARIGLRAAECAAAVRDLKDFAERADGGFPPELAAALRRITEASEALERNLRADAEMIASVGEELRGGLQMLQLIQASSMLDPLRRAVHDHARRVGKEALLEIAGAEASVDRRILQELRGAITHVLRNAVDHGIEAPCDRAAAGKPARARIHLELTADGTDLELAVSDDGRGLDPERIRRVARERGLVSTQELDGMPDEEVLRLIWLPGFSTSGSVTETSGRGLGLDAVHACVASLSGRVEIASVVGRGTTFRFHIPISQYLRAGRG